VLVQLARAERVQLVQLLPRGGLLLQHAEEGVLRDGARERLRELPPALLVIARVAGALVVVEHAQIAQRSEVVLAEPSELVLEVAVRALEGRIVLESKRAVLLDAQELVAPDHGPAVEAVIVVADHAGMADRDEREQALCATSPAPRFLETPP